eukprot:TRINITY_DN101085_c0_g1_i1.p1 TRINITY_DN101085_c0_g1~~TRINITY_DN101085_c0_g1_i1.p1  ORF type:complete len:345 (+),score=79.92 TRINITY_DN101085_c0_g1_i1:89-1123(+)
MAVTLPRLAGGLALVGGVVADDAFYVVDSQSNKYLTCNDKLCTFEVTPTQLFRKGPGDKGQYRFHILNNKGEDSGQCLDREHCQHGSSNARMASCNHCGAYHWDFKDKKLAEDGMKNCIKSDGSVGHCSDSFAAINMIPETCQVASQTITDLKCKNELSGGICGANFQKGSVVGASSESDCNACHAAQNSTTHCTFSLSVTSSTSIDTSFSSATDIGLKYGAKFEEGGIIFKAEESIEFSVDETLTYGKSTTKTKTTEVNNACSADIVAGTRESVKANVMTGTIIGEFTATVTTKWSCPGKPDDVHKDQRATMTIKDVPTQSVIGSCTPLAGQCSKADMQELVV